MTKNNTQSKTYNSFGVLTLLKLIQIEADKSHAGVFAILATGDGYKVAFGAGVLTGSGWLETRVLPTLKGALTAALAREWAPTETAVAASSGT
ncbi:MAG TPA: hypothetical protein VFV58_13275 [Blastocatellia bacterium]|jgi:hypothetical protein|nr:hypothetical protein [Blastocatellia bacterium]